MRLKGLIFKRGKKPSIGYLSPYGPNNTYTTPGYYVGFDRLMLTDSVEDLRKVFKADAQRVRDTLLIGVHIARGEEHETKEKCGEGAHVARAYFPDDMKVAEAAKKANAGQPPLRRMKKGVRGMVGAIGMVYGQ